MARIFISHSGRDNFEAIAFRDWLVSEGWASDDVFLDLHGIGAGARWKEVLARANERCEAVLFLVSPHSLASNECYVEIRMAEDMGKVILPAILPARAPEDRLSIEDHRLAIYRERQIVDASIEPREATFRVEHLGEQRTITFHAPTLARLKARLDQLGISPDSFAWTPHDLDKANPYPGLAGFSRAEAALFFGRDGDLARGFASLRKLRRTGIDRGQGGLLVIQAASGAGKSSFLKAGLWPRLARDPDFTPIGILRPATGILCGDTGIGRQFSAFFAQHGRRRPAVEIHNQLRADGIEAQAQLAALIAEAIEIGRDTQRLADSDAIPPTPVIAVDQAEELFAADDAEESRRFLSLMADVLALGNRPDKAFAVPLLFIWTIRADSIDALLQATSTYGLGAPELFPLPPIPRTGYAEIINGPLAVANKAGMRLAIDPLLTQQLIDASDGADALPLLAYTLHQLVEDTRAGSRAQISINAFESGGGIGGVLTKRLAAAQRASGADDLRLQALFIPHLATWDAESNPPGAKRLVADETELFVGERAVLRPLADELVNERLLTRGAGEGGRKTLEVAHEALLRQSPIADWLAVAREFLVWRDRLSKARALFDANGRGLLIGRELEVARAWVRERRPDDIAAADAAFVAASIAEDERRAEHERAKELEFARLREQEAIARERQAREREQAAAQREALASAVARAGRPMRIFLTNLLGLLLLIGGMLWLGQRQDMLVGARRESLKVQGDIIAAAISAGGIASGRIEIDPDRLPDLVDPKLPLRDDTFAALEYSFGPDRVGPMLRRLVRDDHNTRARLYSRDGALIVDTQGFDPRRRQNLLTDGVADSNTPVKTVWTRVLSWFAGTDLPLYREIGTADGNAYPEVRSALSGQTPPPMLLLTEEGQQVVSLAVPVRTRNVTLGALMLSTRPGEIDEILLKERQLVATLALLALATTLLTSFLLARAITKPMQQLDQNPANPK